MRRNQGDVYFVTSSNPEALAELANDLFIIVDGCFEECTVIPDEFPLRYIYDWFDSLLVAILNARFKALDLGGQVSSEVHSLLFLIEREYASALDLSEHGLSVSKMDEGTEDSTPWPEVSVLDDYILRPLNSSVRTMREKYMDRLAFMAADLYTESLSAGADMFKIPLGKRAQIVYEAIIEFGPIEGPAIIEKLDANSRDDIQRIDQSTLTKEIIPELKRLRGVVNKRGAGYYDPRHYDPQKSARK